MGRQPIYDGPRWAPPQDAGESHDWAKDAGCRTDERRDLFFHPDGENGKAYKRRDDAARAICNGICPVQQLCLEYAVRNRERYGVWGGLGELELRKLQDNPQGGA